MASSNFLWTLNTLTMVLMVVSASPFNQKLDLRSEDSSYENDLTHTTAAVSLPGAANSVDDLSDIPDTGPWDSRSPEVYSLRVQTDVRFRYANTLVTSRVVNRDIKPAEVIFKFFLPENAFISGFLMEVKGKVYKAYVKEKEQAKKEYVEAISRGQTAAHVAVSARNSNLFAVSVNLEPQSKITFNLTYEELLSRRLGLYDIVVHLVTCDKVIHDMRVDVSINELQNITAIRVPEPTLDNKISDAVSDGLVEIIRGSSKSFLITYAPTKEQQRKLLSHAESETSLEHVVEERPSQRLRVQYDVEHHQSSGDILLNDGYFVHFFAPSVESGQRLSKHVIFVLDTSGSMFGRKIQQLKEAMGAILDSLEDNKDYFSIIQFSSSALEWQSNEKKSNSGEGIHPVTSNTITEAKEYINSLKDYGGTNIGEALVLALKIAAKGIQNKNTYKMESRNVNNMPQQIIVFLTDGYPTVGLRDNKILASVRALNSDSRVPVFSLAFGDSADFSFLKRLSLRNHAFARKIYEAADAALQLKSFFQEISIPLLNNVKFSYVGPKVDQSSLSQTVFHTYFSGTEIVVVGRVDGSADSSSDVGGMVSSSYYTVPASSSETDVAGNGSHLSVGAIRTQSTPSFHHTASSTMKASPFGVVVEGDMFQPDALPPTAIGRENHESKLGSLEKMWAFLTIRQLLAEVFSMEEETGKRANITVTTQMRAAREKALQLSLKYGFVTSLTSLVVVKPLDDDALDSQGNIVFDPNGVSPGRSIHTMINSMPDDHGSAWIPSSAHSDASSPNLFFGTKILLTFTITCISLSL